MRTTLTLEDDVAADLKRIRRRSGKSLKEVVNSALRVGLRDIDSPSPPPKPFRVKPADLGKCLLGSIDDVGEVLAVAEGEDFK